MRSQQQLRERLLESADAEQGEMIALLLAAAEAVGSVGECRKITPFKPLFVVQGEQETYYECGHNPVHTTVIGHVSP